MVFSKIAIKCALFLLPLTLGFVGCTDDDDDDRRGPSVLFPRDAAPHQDRTEWWYYTGHLSDGERSWGFQVTIFYFILDPIELYMCHVAVIDHAEDGHFAFQSMDGAASTWSSEPIDLEVSACHLLLDNEGNDRIVGVIPEGRESNGIPGEWVIELDVEPQKEVVLHGVDGVIDMGDGGGQSWYYSYTRLAASGYLTTPDGRLEVTGPAWMDHQWGDFDVNQFQGWDWWSMQLDDDWEVMLFQFRNWQGQLVTQAGTLVAPDGELTDLIGLDAFSVTSRRTWESPHTDGVYPLDWDISIIPMSWDLEVRTSIDDQEMHNPAQNYWEGPVTITGTRGGEPASGLGFVELTGYATDNLDP